MTKLGRTSAMRIFHSLTPGADVTQTFTEDGTRIKEDLAPVVAKMEEGRVPSLARVWWEIGLRSGQADVKICAIDEIWSGLKSVSRKPKHWNEAPPASDASET